MSTDDGHSLLHPLHDRHKTSASRTESSAKPPGIKSVVNASNRMRARPRVEWISSRVAMYEGHIEPASVLRHLPIPTHRSAAPASPSSALKSKCVLSGSGRYCAPCLRCESSGKGSTRLPGFII